MTSKLKNVYFRIIELFMRILRNKINEEIKDENKIDVYEFDEEKFLISIRNISLFHLND